MSDLPDGWEWTTLGELGEAKPGFASGRHNRSGDGLIHIRPMNITRTGKLALSDVRYVNDMSDRRVVAGEILFNNTNSPDLVGKSAHVNIQGEYAYSNHMTRLRVDEYFSPEFLSLYLHFCWLSGYFKSVMSHHVSQASVSTNVLKRTRVVVPPLAEQRRIVAVLEGRLSQLQQGESLLRRIAEKEQFLTKTLIDEKIKQIPSRQVRFADVLKERLTNGRSVPTRSGGFPVLRLTALKSGFVDTTEQKEGDWEYDQAVDFLVSSGDFLITRGNGSLDLVAQGALVRKEPDPVAFPDTMIRARPNIELLNPDYLCMVWSSRMVRNQIHSLARTTAGIYKVNQKALGEIILPLPSLQQQQHIVRDISDVRDTVAKFSTKVAASQTRADHLRRTLLREAFAGRLVPQDPEDEPASVLLERIRAERGSASTAKASRKKPGTKSRSFDSGRSKDIDPSTSPPEAPGKGTQDALELDL